MKKVKKITKVDRVRRCMILAASLLPEEKITIKNLMKTNQSRCMAVFDVVEMMLQNIDMWKQFGFMSTPDEKRLTCNVTLNGAQKKYFEKVRGIKRVTGSWRDTSGWNDYWTVTNPDYQSHSKYGYPRVEENPNNVECSFDIMYDCIEWEDIQEDVIKLASKFNKLHKDNDQSFLRDMVRYCATQKMLNYMAYLYHRNDKYLNIDLSNLNGVLHINVALQMEHMQWFLDMISASKRGEQFGDNKDTCNIQICSKKIDGVEANLNYIVK